LSNNTVISLKGVSKQYRQINPQQMGIKNFILTLPRRLMGKMPKKNLFSALETVSFDVKNGECFGIVGPNGSGKSTMLGLIAGVLKPSSGNIRTDGRISPLLELGAGFHPELSGRENIILNGILLGMTKVEIHKKYQDIVDFSELEDFIEQPLRTYSSGMVARLGFSVAIYVDPEILLIDEILSVGDIAFGKKCMDRMHDFLNKKTTILFISHNINAVETICTRVLWLDHGQIRMLGEAKYVCKEYKKVMLHQ